MYKVLNGLESTHGGHAHWTLGEWMPTRPAEMCESGYHLLEDERALLDWIGPDIYEAEGRGSMQEEGGKICFAQARIVSRYDTWNERAALHFSCDCAAYALTRAPDDQRELLEAVIEIARARADWPDEWAETAELARDAVLCADEDSARAWAGAGAAVRGAVATAAGGAAWDAARGAAWDAAWDAVEDAVAAAAGGATWVAAEDAARADLAAILKGYLDGTSEWTER